MCSHTDSHTHEGERWRFAVYVLPEQSAHIARPPAANTIGIKIALAAHRPQGGQGQGLLNPLLHALDLVLHVGVQLAQAVDGLIRGLPVPAAVSLQEGGHLHRSSNRP